MKVVVKTLRNVKHELEVSTGDTVADIKKKLAAMKLAEVDAQKLLHKGKILRDSQVGADTFAEGDTIILMKSRKPKPKPKPKVVSEPELPVSDENSPSSANVQPVQQIDADAVYKQIKAMQEARQAEQAAALKAEYEEKIEQLAAKLGADKASCAQALALAKGDAELAFNYLTQGIPPEVALNSGMILSDVQKKQIEAAVAQKKAREEFEKLTPEQQAEVIQRQRIAKQKQMEAAAVARGLDTQGMPPRLAMLMSNPAMMSQVLGNPMVQMQIQGLMQQENPELFQQFQANPDEVADSDEFQKIVFKFLAKAMGAQQPRARPNVIRLSKEESDGITVVEQEFEGRFPRQFLLQQYIAVGRDFAQLREFLQQQLEAVSSTETQQTTSEQNPADDCEPE